MRAHALKLGSNALLILNSKFLIKKKALPIKG